MALVRWGPLFLGLIAIILQCVKKKSMSNIVLPFPNKQWQTPVPLHPWVISQISSWGQRAWKGFLEVRHCLFSFFVMPVQRKSKAFSGLTPASPSHLIWLNCSAKYYSGLWVWPYLPAPENKLWIDFSHPLLPVSSPPFLILGARLCNTELPALSHSPAFFLIDRHYFGHALLLWSYSSEASILKGTFSTVSHLHFFSALGVIPASLSDLLHFNLLHCSFTSLLHSSAFANASVSLPIKCHLGMVISPSPSKGKDKWKEMFSFSALWLNHLASHSLWLLLFHHHGTANKLYSGLPMSSAAGTGLLLIFVALVNSSLPLQQPLFSSNLQ